MQKKNGLSSALDIKAFTLIELLVVVLIIGILAAVALPQYTKAVEKSRMTEGISLTSALGKAEERYFLANNTYTADFDALDLSVTGTITSYSGDVPGVQTKYFLCRAADPDSVVGRPYILAACNRIPFATFYAIIYLSDGRLGCFWYNEKGKNLCKSFGGTEYDSRTFLIQ